MGAGLGRINDTILSKLLDEVKEDIVNFCLNVLNQGASVQDVNKTFRALISKTARVENMKHLHPSTSAMCYTRQWRRQWQIE